MLFKEIKICGEKSRLSGSSRLFSIRSKDGRPHSSLKQIQVKLNPLLEMLFKISLFLCAFVYSKTPMNSQNRCC